MQMNTVELESFNEPGVMNEIIQQVRFSNREVLFVDDDGRWLKILARWFESTPYKCHFASSGIEALEILEKRDIDIIISDMSMPLMSGGELMKLVQARHPDIRRIIMSGKFDVMSTIDAINQGQIHRYIVKPCVNKDLKLAVYEALQFLENKEKQQTRDIEIRKSAVERIKTMGKSLRQMNKELEIVHEGIIQLTRNLGNPDQQQFEQASQFMVMLTEICKYIDLNPEPTRQLELAATFLKLPSISPGSIQLDEDGQVSFTTRAMEPAKVADQSVNILSKLGYPIASQIVEQFASYHCDPNLTLDDDGVDVGSALLLLVQDLYVLNDECGLDLFTGLKVLEPHAQRYGTEIYYEILSNFRNEVCAEIAH